MTKRMRAEPEHAAAPRREEEPGASAAPPQHRAPSPAIPAALATPGRPLDAETRTTMEGRFGHDFSRVRLHDDERAATSASAIGARAYTVGDDIVLGAGAFAPQSGDGQRLLAHELTHVVQQAPASPVPQAKMARSVPGDAAEREADAVADRVVAGEPVAVAERAAPGIYGSWLGDAADAVSGAASAVGGAVADAAGGVADTVSDLVGDATDSREDEERLDAEEDLADFMGEEFDVENHHPTTGRGLFDASYRPATGNLTISLKIAFDFVNGDPTDAEWLVVAAGRTFTADQFVWTPEETEEWKTRAMLDVEGAWSERFVFHNTRPFWEGLPSVNVNIDIVEVPADEAHYVTTVRKWPEEPGKEESVTPPGTADQSTARFQESATNGITTPDVDSYSRTTASQPEYGVVDTDNPTPIRFDLGKADVNATDRARLEAFGRTLARPEIPPFPVTLTGRASSEGSEESNTALSEQRAQAVSNILVPAGAKVQPTVVPLGEAGAAATPEWRRVDISVGAFQSSQTTIRHEFGHMFGLGDEYPNAGSGRPVGTPVAHSALAQRLIPGQQPVVATHNENIMSTGETIRPHHYVTFLEVLGTMTGTTGQWAVGPGRGRAPAGPGDFPVPDPDGPRTA